MKKLTKILATVLTLSMAMSTVIMPTTAEAAALDFPFETTHEGVYGKDLSDKVKALSANYRSFTAQAYQNLSTDAVTYEAQIALEPNAKLTILAFNDSAYTERGTVRFVDGNVYVRKSGDTYSSATHDTGVDYENQRWYKVAIVKTQTEWKFYLDGELIGTCADTHITAGRFTKDFAVTDSSGTYYIDNMRVYEGEYDPTNDVMPIQATGLSFLEGEMTVAEAKALALDTQAGGPATVRVYKDYVGGTEVADTEMLGKDWYVVITSLSGDYYRADGIFRVSSAIDCTGVTYADNTVTATVTNNLSSPVASMMMVLVEDGGQFVMSSEVITNIEDTATFTITGVDSLSNAEVFFVKSWADLAPVLDSTFDVE